MNEKKKKSKRSLTPLLRLWPYVAPYRWLLVGMLVWTVCFACCDGGRAELVRPLLNTILGSSGAVKDQFRDKAVVGGLPQVLQEEAKAAPTPEPSAAAIAALQRDATLGGVMALDRAAVGDEAVSDLLERTGEQLLDLADGGLIPVSHSKGWRSLAQAVALQQQALDSAAAGKADLAALLSMRSRSLGHDATFAVVLDTLVWFFAAAFLLAVGMSLFKFLMDYSARVLSARAFVDLQNFTTGHLLTLPVGFFEDGQRGDVLARLFMDIRATSQLITIVTSLLTRTIHVAILGVWALTISPELLIGLGVIAAPILLIVRRLGKAIRRAAQTRQEIQGDSVEAMQQMFSGFREVKAFMREGYEGERFTKIANASADARVAGFRARVASKSIQRGFNDVLLPILFCGGGYFVVTRQFTLDVGDFGAFLALVVLMYVPAKVLGVSYNSLMSTIPSLDRVLELLDLRNDMNANPGGPKVSGVERSVVFEDVSFSYTGDTPVLEGISFEAPVGSLTAVVGSTGSGKSTLVDLILRTYDPSSGRVLIDGVDLAKADLAEYLRQVAVVPQECFVFNESIRENIRYGRLDATDAEVEEAAKVACIHEEILEFPEGYETLAGERGGKLSGGQVQRLAIARAVLKNPSVLVLDEATSALDTGTEGEVQVALDALARSATTFVVAHRLSTVRGADQILVIDRGRLVERGTHDDLVAAGGVYAALVSRQIEGGADGPAPDEEEQA